MLWSLEFGVGVFHEFLLINLLGWAIAGTTAGWIAVRIAETIAEHTAMTNFDLSTGRLASRKHAEELWPLKRSIERRTLTGISLRRCKIGCMRGVFWLGIWLERSHDGKVAWNCIFLTSVFPFRCVFPATSRKKNRETSPPEYKLTLSVRRDLISNCTCFGCSASL